MDETEIELSRKYAEAMHEHQAKFDVSAEFDRQLLTPGFVLTEAALAEADRIKREQEDSLQRMNAARDDYLRYKSFGRRGP